MDTHIRTHMNTNTNDPHRINFKKPGTPGLKMEEGLNIKKIQKLVRDETNTEMNKRLKCY